jgi:hypothetical protein
MFEVVFFLLVAVVVLAVVGHGIWVVFAAIIRVMVGTLEAPARRRPDFIEGHICPRCLEAWSSSSSYDECPVCEWNPLMAEAPARAHPARLIARLAHRFERFAQFGLLPRPMAEQLQATIQPEREPAVAPGASRATIVGTPPPNVVRPAVSEPQVHRLPTKLPDRAPTELPPRAPIESLTRPPSLPVAEPVILVAELSLPRVPESVGTGPITAPVASVASPSAPVEPVRRRETVAAPPATAPPGQPSEPVSRMLAAFLEDKNIRWGELVGGLIVVGCSVALVLSFWASIAERPFLKYGLFLGVTAGLFGLGLHAERRWKLPTTALGLLSIGVLLIPLNCLAISSFEHMSASWSLGAMLSEFGAVAVCGGLLLAAGQYLVPHARYALLPAVLVPSALVFLVPDGLVKSGPSLLLLALGALPALGQGLALAKLDRGQRRAGPLAESTAWEFTGLTGLSSFAVILCTGLLLVRNGPISAALHAVGPVLPVLGAPVLLSGLSLWRRSEAPEMTPWRTAGVALAAAGGLILVGGIACAWPEPRLLIPAAILDALVFSVLAVGFSIPLAHLMAGVAAAFAYLLLVAICGGPLSWQTTDPISTCVALGSSSSGVALLPAALAFAAGAWALSRRGRTADAQAYGLLAGLAAIVSLVLVSWFSLGSAGDPGGAAWVYAAYALVAYFTLLVKCRGDSSSLPASFPDPRHLAGAATGLALLALVQALVFGGHLHLATPWLAALLTHAALAVGAALLLGVVGRPPQDRDIAADSSLNISAIVTSTCAAALIVLAVPLRSHFALMLDSLVLALVWMFLAWGTRSRWLALGAHAAVLGSVLLGTATVLARRPEFLSSAARWLDPWSIAWLGCAAAGFAWLSITFRWGVSRLVAARPTAGWRQRLAQFVETPFAVDHAVLMALAAVVVGLSVYGVVPGMAQELAPRSIAARLAEGGGANALPRLVPPVSAFEWPGIDHRHASGGGTWVLLGLVAAGLIARQRLEFRPVDVVRTLGVAVMAALLLSARSEPTQSVATVLLWTTAISLVGGSLLVWNRNRLGRLSARLGGADVSNAGSANSTPILATLLAMALLCTVGLAVFPALVSMRPGAPEPSLQPLWVFSALVLVGLATLMILWGRIQNRLLGASEPPGPGWVIDRARPALMLILSLATFLLLAVSAHVSGRMLIGDPIVGPAPGSFFDRLGPVGSYVPPVALLALVLAGHAIREQSSGFAFVAGLVTNAAVTFGYILAQSPGGSLWDVSLWVRLAQLNAITSSLVAWVWQKRLAMLDRAGKGRGTPVPALLNATIALAVVLTWLPLLVVPLRSHFSLTVDFLVLTLVWGLLAWMTESVWLSLGAQLAALAATLLGTGLFLARQPEFLSSAARWLAAWSVARLGCAGAVFALVTIGVRLLIRSLLAARPSSGIRQRLSRLADTPFAVDHAVLLVLSAVVISLAVSGVVPGVDQELAPQSRSTLLTSMTEADTSAPVVSSSTIIAWPGFDYRHAAGGGSWALLTLVLAGLLAKQWIRFQRGDLWLALGVAGMAALLFASAWEPSRAVASALRWSTALALFGGSLLVWNRDHLGRLAMSAGWSIPSEPAASGSSPLVAILLSLMLLPLAGMGAYVCLEALQARLPAPAIRDAWGVSAAVFAGLAILTFLWGRLEQGLTGAGERQPAMDLARSTLVVLLTLATMVLLAISVHVVAQALAGDPIVGPAPGSLFDRLGPIVSYVPPIALLALVLAGYAFREQSPGFAFASGLVANVAATTGYVLAQPASVSLSDARLWVGLAQWNVITSSLVAWVWQGGIFLANRHGKRLVVGTPALLVITIDLAVALICLSLVVGAFTLWITTYPSSLHVALTGPLGWIAFDMLLLLVAAHPRAVSLRSLGMGHALLLGFTTFLAFNLARSDSGDWRTYHAMLAAPVVAALLSLGLAWHFAGLRLGTMSLPSRAAAVRWGSFALALVVVFALRGYLTFSDPTGPWWSIGALASVIPLSIVLAVWSRSDFYLGVAAMLVNLAGSLAFFEWSRLHSSAPLLDLAYLNALALAAPVPVWLWVQSRWLRSNVAGTETTPPRVPALASWLSLGLVAGAAVFAVLFAVDGQPLTPFVLLSAGSLVATAVAFLSRMRTASVSSCVFGLYVVGLCVVSWGVNQVEPPAALLPWLGSIVLAAFTLATSYLWCRRSGLRAAAERLGLIAHEAATDGEVHTWLIPANVLLAAGVLALAVLTVLSEPNMARRLLSGKAALSQALAIGLLARGERRSSLQRLALGLVVLGAGIWSWACLDPASPDRWFDRLALTLAVVAGATVVYGIGLVKWLSPGSEWARAARSLTPGLAVAGSALLVAGLGQESRDWLVTGSTALSPLAISTIGLVLGGLALGCLSAAVVPGRDPFALSERGRTAYVYAAELLLALLVFHLRMTLPWLFGGLVAQYWSLIILGVAFLGVGLSEVFRRQGRAVLAEPLERSGALLPILPLLAAFWTPLRPGLDSFYLMLAGALYGLASLQRRSAGYGALAALGFNAALWSVLGRWQGFGLLEHPQLWIIPPALCVLVAGYLNRDRLTDTQQASLRYGAALAIYLSSTADIVLTGVAHAPWLPSVLGALALGGIFFGILLRVRGFLMLGLGFLGLALFSMIWFAAVDLHQTWLWWATGIVVGCLILALFAVFEKKRLEVLQLLHQMKGWSP